MGLSGKKTQFQFYTSNLMVDHHIRPKNLVYFGGPSIVDQLPEDPLKQPQTAEAAEVSAVKPPTWGVQSGGQSCYHLSASYSPLDMPSAGRTREVNYEQCHWLEEIFWNRFCLFLRHQK